MIDPDDIADLVPEILDPETVADLPQLSYGARQLPVQLTDAEWRETCEQSAAAFDELTKLHEAEKDRRSNWNAGHKERTAEHRRLATMVHTKQETRRVDVITYGSLDENARITIRTDTYEVLGRSVLTASEHERLSQGEMFSPGEVPLEDDEQDQAKPPPDRSL